MELYSSMRALYRSNHELQACIDNGNGEDEDDPVYREAIEENWEVLRKQRLEALQLVTQLKQLPGLGSTFELPDDIIAMDVPAHPDRTTRTRPTTIEPRQRFATIHDEDAVGARADDQHNSSPPQPADDDDGVYL